MPRRNRRPRSCSLLRASILALALVVPALATAQTGSITGTVTDAQTGAPIVGLDVGAYNLDLLGGFGVGATDASGTYTITGLVPGRYAVLTAAERDAAFPYQDEVFDNIPCLNRNNCDFPEAIDGTFITVTAGGTAGNVDFALEPLGSVTGTVTNAFNGVPFQNVTVNAVISLGSSAVVVESATTNAAGVYTLTRLPAGSVYLYTSNNQTLVNEIFDDIGCVGSCSPTTAVASGTAVPVTAGGTTTGRDFALNFGGAISGTITNAVTGAPIQFVNVQAATRVGTGISIVGAAGSNASGVYTIAGLAPGNYFVFTTGGSGTMTELYDNILCPLNCNPIVTSGVEVPVTLSQTTPGKDFALEIGGSITGTVTNAATSMPVQGAQVTVVTRVGDTNFQRSVTTNASGTYFLGGLPTGTYRAYISSAPFGLVPEIFDNLPCIGSCSINTAIATGTPIDVTQGSTTSGRNFALSPGGGISGTVRDAATGNPIPDDVEVEIYARSGSSLIFIGSDGVSPTGTFEFAGLAAGDYVLATSGIYRNEVYDNIPCVGSSCSAALGSATPITVALGTLVTGKDFSLDRGEILFGKVTSSATGQPLTGAIVSLYQRGSGAFAGSATVDYRGGFAFAGLANGSYVAFTSNSQGYQNEIYDGIPCATTCSAATALASGTPINITGAGADAPALVTGINFALDVRSAAPAAPTNFRASVSGFTAQFSWTPPTPSTTGVAFSYVIDAGVAPGTTIVSLPAGSGTSFTVPGVPSGTFYVRVRAINASGSSGPSNEVMLVISGAGVSPPLAPTNPVAFLLGGQLTLTWAAAIAGEPATGYLVEAGSASGLANIATLPVAGRSFTYNGVPPGFYFLRVRATNAGGVSPPSPEVMIVTGGVPSPPGPPAFTSAQASGNTVTLNWVAPTFGTAMSYVIEAGSAAGQANLAVVNTGNTNTTISFGGVPPGTYYVRLRAVNAQGMSIVSNERVVMVQ